MFLITKMKFWNSLWIKIGALRLRLRVFLESEKNISFVKQNHLSWININCRVDTEEYSIGSILSEKYFVWEVYFAAFKSKMLNKISIFLFQLSHIQIQPTLLFISLYLALIWVQSTYQKSFSMLKLMKIYHFSSKWWKEVYLSNVTHTFKGKVSKVLLESILSKTKYSVSTLKVSVKLS